MVAQFSARMNGHAPSLLDGAPRSGQNRRMKYTLDIEPGIALRYCIDDYTDPWRQAETIAGALIEAQAPPRADTGRVRPLLPAVPSERRDPCGPLIARFP